MAFIGRKAAGFILLALAWAVPALAAPLPPVIDRAADDPNYADSGLVFFSPVSGRGYNLDASLVTLYDGNIIRLGNGQPLRPGAQKSDVRISPVIAGNIGVPIGRQQFFVGAQLGADIYGANTQLNRERYAMGGGFNLSAGSSCTGTVAANYSSRQIVVSEQSESIPNGRTVLNYGLTAGCQSPAGLGAGVTLQRIDTGNTALSRESFDVNSVLISPYISYSRPSLGRFSLTANLNYLTFPNRIILTTDGDVQEDGTNIFSARFGYQRDLGTRLQLTAGISYLETSPQPATILAEDADLGILFPLVRDKFSGMGYDLQLSYTPGTRLAGALYFARDVRASPNVGALYQVNTAYGMDINYQMGQAITLGLGGTYTILDFAAGFGSPTEVIPREKDNIGRVYGRITYATPRLFNVSLLLAYQNRVSIPAIYSFDSFSAVLTISFDFGRNS
jgi:hypothetical protein